MDKVVFIISFESIYFLCTLYFQNKNVKKNGRFSFITYLGNLLCYNFMSLAAHNSEFLNIFQYSICVAVYLLESAIYFFYFEMFFNKKYKDVDRGVV